MTNAPERIWAVYDPGDDSASIMPTLLAYDEPEDAVAPAITYDTTGIEYIRADLSPDPDAVKALVETAQAMVKHQNIVTPPDSTFARLSGAAHLSRQLSAALARFPQEGE